MILGKEMDSIAIWCNKKDSNGSSGGDPVELEVHFNLWKLKDSRTSGLKRFIQKLKGSNTNEFSHFLDIGIMLEQPTQVSHINMFFPFLIGAVNGITDLGEYFKRHNDLVSAVFNRDCRVITTPNDKLLNVEVLGSDKQFSIYSLDTNSDIAIKNIFGGSKIKIAVPKSSVEHRLYFRLRINSPGVNSLTREYRPMNSIVESAFTITEVVDFKINRTRSIDKSLLELIRSEDQIEFSIVQFFLMREAHYDYVFSHTAVTRSRLLEKEIWNPYVGDHYKLDNIVAYQWRSEKLSSFTAFVKYKFDRNNWRTIIVFILVFLFLGTIAGIIGGLIANLIWH